MGNLVRVDAGSGRKVSRVLPRVSGGALNSQSPLPEELRVTTEAERLAKLEGKTETYDKMFVRMVDTLDSINLALNKLVALEERHQSLDLRHQQLRSDFSENVKKRGERFERLEARVRDIEGVTGLNTHGRDIWERLIIPLISSATSGVLVATAVYFFLQTAVNG